MIFLRCCEADKKRKLEKVCMKIPLVQDVSASSEPEGIFLTESSKSPASIAKSNKQWVGTCLYQEECKLLLINCGAVIRL